MIDFNKIRSRRVIDALRANYPGSWRYEWPYWHHESGWYVGAYAELAPRYDGDDDSFQTTYRRSDTNEIVSL